MIYQNLPRLPDISKKNTFIIWGCGLSGQGAAKLLLAQGFRNIILIDRDESKANDSLNLLNDFAKEQSLTSQILSFQQDTFFASEASHHINNTCWVLSPGISPDFYFSKISFHNSIWMTEVELAFLFLKNPWIGITGTNGKSTVTAMLAHILNKSGMPAVACGNIGLSLCDIISQGLSIRSERLPILCIELSSYQLTFFRINKKPLAAIFCSFSPDHLERHKTVSAYLDAKLNLFRLAARTGAPLFADSLLIEKINDLDDISKSFIAIKATDSYKSEKPSIFRFSHNRLNGELCVSTLKTVFDLDPIRCKEFLLSFEGLPFRLQKVGQTRNGYEIINDSKSTNLDNVVQALSCTDSPRILILGGVTKGEDFAELRPLLSAEDRVICFGKDGPMIYKQISSGTHQFSIDLCSSLATVFDRLRHLGDISSLNGTILFSPGCASFDEFKNFTDRGQIFNRLILERL